MGVVDELKDSLRNTFTKVKEDIENNSKKISLLEEQNKKLLHEIQKLRGALKEKEAAEAPLKNELLRKFNRNKKNIIKGKILDVIGGSRNLTVPELKEIVVEQMHYCSKATFYRYILELKKNGLLDFANLNDKEIVLLSRQM